MIEKTACLPTARDPHQVRNEAVAWYTHICSGDATPEDIEKLRQWCAEHADNQRAWERFDAMRRSFANLPAQIATPTLLVASKARRRIVQNMVLLASTGTITYVGYQFTKGSNTSPFVWLADYRTRVGEQREVVLADGSHIILNTDTAVDIAFDTVQRLIRLRTGELLVESAKHRLAPGSMDDKRPLLVATVHGTIKALGTRFSVRQFDDRTEVIVTDDAVEIHPANAPGQVVVLNAGQHMAFTQTRHMEIGPSNDNIIWQLGSLVINDWRLEDVLAELARYRRGYITCDDAVASIRVSGAFPLADIDRALMVLARTFPLKITSITRYWIRVTSA